MNTQPKLRKSELNCRLPPLGGFVQQHIKPICSAPCSKLSSNQPAIYVFTFWQHYQRRTEHCSTQLAFQIIQSTQVLAIIGRTSLCRPTGPSFGGQAYLYMDITLINIVPWWKPHKLHSFADNCRYHSLHCQIVFIDAFFII
ncbi:MAG: hypothetical protein ACJAT1_002174 [Marivirga sp.]|jgi:hypothetical protein